ncbi:MAG TPA: tetratricopeptide repeat protein [Chitinophagaceae bacterium]
MKKIVLIPILLMAVWSFGQKVDDAKRFLYYERFESAKKQLHQLLRNDPVNAEAWYLLADAYQSSGRPVTDTLQMAPDNVKDEPFYLVALGSSYLYNNNAIDAERYFNEALEKTKYKNAGIILAVANAKIKNKPGDANQVIELINRVLRKHKHNAAMYVALGKAYRKLNNGSQAFLYFKQAIEMDKNYAEPYYLTGMIFRTQNNAELYLEYFNNAIAADINYAPAYYQLYHHYYFRNVNTARTYLEKFISLSDHDIQNDYNFTDILYLTGDYKAAIAHANKLIEKEKSNLPARIYKLIAYSNHEIGNNDESFKFIHKYFSEVRDSNIIARDFILLADLYAERKEMDSAIFFYSVGVALERDTAALVKYYRTLADLSKELKDYNARAMWLGKYYNNNPKSTNVDLFNWGLAYYQAENFEKADSVFGIYSQRYPEQDFGYYWQARSNAAIDSLMEKGLAVPHYLKVVEIGEKDSTANSKKHLIEAYGYLATYQANQIKDYDTAITYFEKILTLDPDNDQVKKYLEVLQKTVAKKEALTDS